MKVHWYSIIFFFKNFYLHPVSCLLKYFNFCLLVIPVIEQLPMDLKERFTEMREMDLQVQSKSFLLPHDMNIVVL